MDGRHSTVVRDSVLPMKGQGPLGEVEHRKSGTTTALPKSERLIADESASGQLCGKRPVVDEGPLIVQKLRGSWLNYRLQGSRMCRLPRIRPKAPRWDPNPSQPYPSGQVRRDLRLPRLSACLSADVSYRKHMPTSATHRHVCGCGPNVNFVSMSTGRNNSKAANRVALHSSPAAFCGAQWFRQHVGPVPLNHYATAGDTGQARSTQARTHTRRGRQCLGVPDTIPTSRSRRRQDSAQRHCRE